MNALWIHRMCAYKQKPAHVESARNIVIHKIARQARLARRYGIVLDKPTVSLDIPHILLDEARFAKQYWKIFGLLGRQEARFHRKPRAQDATNKLLDVGYHHLSRAVSAILARVEVPTSLALLHVAHASDSEPLVYDLMELFRADIVDAVLLRYVRLKKKNIVNAEKSIAHFLHTVNERLERKHFLTQMHSCQTYRYYIELQIQRFIAAVQSGTVFVPIVLPDRHDTRCP